MARAASLARTSDCWRQKETACITTREHRRGMTTSAVCKSIFVAAVEPRFEKQRKKKVEKTNERRHPVQFCFGQVEQLALKHIEGEQSQQHLWLRRLGRRRHHGREIPFFTTVLPSHQSDFPQPQH